MKKKFLALTMASAVMLMGAGYAAWTDQVAITNTVQTGQVDVSFTDRGEAAELKLADYVDGVVDYALLEGDTGHSADQNQWDKANVTLSNLYPGATAEVTLKIQNNSTIPVEMRHIEDTRSDNWGVNGDNFDQIGASLRFFEADGTALAFDNATTYANPWEPAHLVDVELPVGGYAELTFMFTAAENIEENATYTFSPTAVFQQFNTATNGLDVVDQQVKVFNTQK